MTRVERMRFSIPLEIVSLDDTSFHLFVPARINGISCDLIIDTGASKSVFALNHVMKMLDDLPVSQPDLQSAGINANSLDSHTGVFRTFSLGNLFLTEWEVVLLDLSSIDALYRSYHDRTIWGLIGSDFLLTYSARLDYGKKTLSLTVPKSCYKVG